MVYLYYGIDDSWDIDPEGSGGECVGRDSSINGLGGKGPRGYDYSKQNNVYCTSSLAIGHRNINVAIEL